MPVRKTGNVKVNRRAGNSHRIVRGKYTGTKEGWRALSEKVKKRDGYCCRKCGITKAAARARGDFLETDHIVPISRGGTDAPHNLWTLCSTCHSKRPGHKHLQKRRASNANPQKSSSGYRIGSLSR